VSAFRRFEKDWQSESFDGAVKYVKWRYRQAHHREIEGLHYAFSVQSLPNGRSGFIKVERLDTATTGPNPQTETQLIQDNRIVAHKTDDASATRWLEWGTPT
jgi:hypothetical protein